MTEVVLVDVTDRIATITLNRPEARNALNAEVRRALPQAVAECDARDDIDVLILTGADPVVLRRPRPEGARAELERGRRRRGRRRPSGVVRCRPPSSRSSARSTASPSPAASSSR